MIKVLDHGFVELVDQMGNDDTVVDAARVSYGKGTKSVSDNRTLLRYLMRHGHTSPFEMVEFVFHVKLPLFIARQWVRHRTASLNEVSARYSDMGNVEFYQPDFRLQSMTNKQCSTDERVSEETMDRLTHLYNDATQKAVHAYREALDAGVAREVARTILPVSMYTEWIWKCDLHNLLNFIEKRSHPNAQYEIVQYANAIYDIIKPIVPYTIEAYEDYRKNSIRLTALECDVLKESVVGTVTLIDTNNKREQDEWISKRKALFVRA